jgi:hypothetical protein
MKMKTISGVVTIFIIFLLSACERSEPTDGVRGGYVNGTVIETGTTLPIDSAEIRWSPTVIDSTSRTTYTDSMGYYIFYSGFNVGTFEISASKQGFETTVNNVNVVREDTVYLNFELKRME